MKATSSPRIHADEHGLVAEDLSRKVVGRFIIDEKETDRGESVEKKLANGK